MTRKGIKLRIRRHTYPEAVEIAPWLWPRWFGWYVHLTFTLRDEEA